MVKKILKQALILMAVGFVAGKLLESDDPRAQRVGKTIDRFTGNRVAHQPPEADRRWGRQVLVVAAAAGAGFAVRMLLDRRRTFGPYAASTAPAASTLSKTPEPAR